MWKFSKLVRERHPNIFEFVDSMRKEQAATELKAARHDAAVPPAREKKKYIIINQRPAQFKQEYATGERNVFSSTVSACGWAFAQTRMTVSDINFPTWNNTYPIQNNNYLNYKQLSLYLLDPSTPRTGSQLNYSYNGTSLTARK